MPERKLFAVIGRPILHSRSPDIFAAAFAELGVDAEYTRIVAGTAAQAVEIARGIGVSGFNVTAPFKEDVLEHAGWRDPPTDRIEAANTIVASNADMRAFNTDWIGVLQALRRNGCDPRDRRVVVLGAGGAGRAAAWGALQGGAAGVTIANRSAERARSAARGLGCRACPLDDAGAALAEADILVTCLPAGVEAARPEWLRQDLWLLDANYGRPGLAGVTRRAGCRVIDGSEWLIQQALAGLKLFTDRQVDESVLQKGLSAPRQWKNIALIGFMGSGKSTLARLLAESLGMRVVDCDREIERRAGCSITEMFSRPAGAGEQRFRRIEKEVVERAAGDAGAVLALGGGALLDRANLEAVRRSCLAVWLWNSLPTALARAGDGSRPLLARGPGPGGLESLWSARRTGYAAAADMVVGTEHGKPEDAARRIEHEIRLAFES